MVDGQEQKTGTENKGIEITQEKIDSLINEGFAKGAVKAETKLLESLGVDNLDALKQVLTDKKVLEDANKTELEKSLNAIKDVNVKLVTMTEKYDDLLKSNDVNTIALANGVKDVEVFKLLYSQASSVDGFNKDNWITQLKESRGYIFGEKPKEDIINPKPNEGNQKGAITRQQYANLDPATKSKFIKDGGTVTD